MSCFSYKNISLRSGNLHQYNTNLGDPRLLTTKTHYSTNVYSTNNYNNAYGVAEYERILGIIEGYTGKLDFCPHVNDLAATYNALMKELGSADHVMNKAEFLKYADLQDDKLPKQPQGRSAIRSRNAGSMRNHQLRGRGIDNGNVFLDVKAVVQRFQNEKIIAEEERVQAQLNIELEAIKAESARLEQIRINEQKQKAYDEKIRLEKIEVQRLQKINDDEEIRLAKELKEQAKLNEIKRMEIMNLMEAEKQDKIIAKKIADKEKIELEKIAKVSTLIPLSIIGLLLYSSIGKN
tara:strand:- start:113 stop:991 length:879 start_codon:yes stop_codon:yes gene_type:complete